MRAVLYARVSTEEQADGYSVDSQLDACHRYATARGWTVADHVADVAVSGGLALAERPGGRQVLEAITSGAADVVVALRLDRLVRSVRVWVDLVDTAAAAGAAIVTADGAFDMDTSHGRLVAGILATVAAFERDLIAERTREGLAAARANGVRLGQRPYDAALLARVGDLMAEGLGYLRIMAVLNAERRERPNGSTTWTVGATRAAMRAAARAD